MEPIGILLGAVVGAVASGSVQAGSAYLDRGRAARSACRLIYVQLQGAQSAVNDLRERRNWDQMITDWEAYGHAWDKHSDAIVQVLKTTDSATIGTAFECLASLGRSRARHVAGASFDPNDELLFCYAHIISKARLIALKASFTKGERKKQEEVVMKAEDELPITPFTTATAFQHEPTP